MRLRPSRFEETEMGCGGNAAGGLTVTKSTGPIIPTLVVALWTQDFSPSVKDVNERNTQVF